MSPCAGKPPREEGGSFQEAGCSCSRLEHQHPDTMNVGRARFLAESWHFSTALRQTRVLPPEVGLQISAAKLDGARAEPAVAALFPGNCLRLTMPIASRHWTKQWGRALCHSSLAPRTDQRVGSQRPAVLRGSGRRVGTTQARQGAPLLATTHGEAPIPIMRWPEQQISFKDVSFAITTWPPVGPKLVPNLALDVPSSLSLGRPLWLRW